MLTKRETSEGESDFSWTVDFSARRAKAREAMAPHLEDVERQRTELVRLKDKLNALRKAGVKEDALTACRASIASTEKAAREAQAKAGAIDAAVYDLKAVNPRARIEHDTRTPADIIESIEGHSSTIERALLRLRKMLNEDNA
jgi:type I restriction enzyme M protein